MVWLTLGLTRGWGSIIINGWGVGLVRYMGLGKCFICGLDLVNKNTKGPFVV